MSPKTQNPFAPGPQAADNPFAVMPPAADPAPAAEVGGDLEELLDRAEELRNERSTFLDHNAAERAATARAIYAHPEVSQRVGKHDVGGRSFSFRPPSTRRSCDYTTLQRDYPAAYVSVVKVTEPEPDAVPTLYLGKGFAK